MRSNAQEKQIDYAGLRDETVRALSEYLQRKVRDRFAEARRASLAGRAELEERG